MAAQPIMHSIVDGFWHVIASLTVLLSLLIAPPAPAQAVPWLLPAAQGVAATNGHEPLLLGIYFGGMLVLILGALVAWRLLRDVLFAWYGLYLANCTLLQFSLQGLASQYLWPASSWWGARANGVLVGMTVFSALWFAARFLEIKDLSPRMWRLFQAGMLLGLFTLAWSLGGGTAAAPHLDMWPGVAATPVAFLGAAIAWRAHFQPARLLLVAWGGLMVFVLLDGCHGIGWLPHSFVAAHAMPIGSVFEAIVLALALIDRNHQLQLDREQLRRNSDHYLSWLNIRLEKLVAERTQSLQDTIRKLEEQVSRDGLTGLINHRAIMERLEVALKAGQRYGQPVAVLMADLDHFKLINDALGHQVGDLALRAVADALQQGVRASDECGRYGGEEFLMVLPQTAAGDALELAERLRLQVEALALPALRQHRLTLSFGVAVYHGLGAVDAGEMVRRADDALYRAKAEGRNRCVLESPQEGERAASGNS